MIVVQRVESLQYDGTNGVALAAWIGPAEVVSIDDENVLTLSITAYGLSHEAHLSPGWWALRLGNIPQGTMSDEAYQRMYYELPGT